MASLRPRGRPYAGGWRRTASILVTVKRVSVKTTLIVVHCRQSCLSKQVCVIVEIIPFYHPDCEASAMKKRTLDSSEVQRILNAKSSHDWAVKEVRMDLCVCVIFDVTGHICIFLHCRMSGRGNRNTSTG